MAGPMLGTGAQRNRLGWARTVLMNQREEKDGWVQSGEELGGQAAWRDV